MAKDPRPMLSCSGCGASIAPGKKFCGRCGTPVAPVAVGADATPAPAPSTDCPQCGAPLRPGAKFCSKCGSAIAPAAAAPTGSVVAAAPATDCPQCGAPLRPGAKFCGKCGSAIAPAAAAPTVATPAPPAPHRAPAREAGDDGISVRSWLRDASPDEFCQLTLQPAELHGLATALRRARDARSLPQDRIDAVHRVLQAKGPNGDLFTVGLGSLNWSRMTAGAWQPAEEPTHSLWLDFPMARAIAELTETLPPPRPAPRRREDSGAPQARNVERPAPQPAPSPVEQRPLPVAEPRTPPAVKTAADGAASSTSFELRQKDLKRILRRVYYAMDDTPNAGTGAVMQVAPDSLTLSATDGRRIAVATLSIRTGAVEETCATVPRNTVLKLMEILAERNDPVGIRFEGEAAHFHFPQGTLQSRLRPATVPDFRAGFPDGRGADMRAMREDLIRALDLVVPLGETSPRVQWRLEPGQLTVAGPAAASTIKVDYRGGPAEAALNAIHLKEALAKLDVEEVEILVSDVNRCALVTIPGRADFKFVLPVE